MKLVIGHGHLSLHAYLDVVQAKLCKGCLIRESERELHILVGH